MIPFVTAEVWDSLPGHEGTDIATELYPAARPQCVKSRESDEMIFLQEAISAIRTIRAELNIKPSYKLSVVLRPQVTPTRLPGLAAACGLGVLDALDAFAISNEAQLKWPNDLLARNLKLAGILVETARDDTGQTFAVCGVGLNVEHAPRGLGAICLAELGDAPSFSPLAERLRLGVVSRVDAWAATPDERPLDGILGDYLARLAWLGEKVRVLAAEDGSELACGTFETVDPWGRAVVAGVPYASELVSLRPTG